ncbi:MAG: LptF/LptG family permease [Elusimicrobiota bacterium]|jgi:lipopolysaccharide export system permease protein|nr:LptF/LptG family permease [Elusimicrobiota bacterium]
MIKKIHLYIIKEFVSSFLFAMAVFSLLLLLDRVFDLVNLFLSKGISFFTVVQLFSYIYPNILPLAVPMAVLFGILLAYGRLAEDNEITAMKANALNYRSITSPIIIIAAAISIILIFFNTLIAPSLQHKVRDLFEDILMQSPLVSFMPKTTVNLGGYSIYANASNKKGDILSGISIYKFADKSSAKKAASPSDIKNGAISWRITASSASVKIYKSAVQMTLYNGYWQKSSVEEMNKMTHITFKSYTFFIALSQLAKGQSVSVQELNSLEIIKKIKEYKAQKIPYTAYTIEFWTRFVFALAPILFAFIAIPIGMLAGKGGKGIGLLISVGILILYYMLFILSTNLAQKNYAPAGIVMWIPDIVTALFGIYFLLKMVKR